MSEPAWVAKKAAMDALDDGYGPWWFGKPEMYWENFKAWANDHLGQGYSLACFEGAVLDPVTSWAFTAYQAGRDHVNI